MRFLGTLLLLTGYTLVYASVAVHGKFAYDPWYGLFADAYVEQERQQAEAKADKKAAAKKSSGGSDWLNPFQIHAYNLGPVNKVNSWLEHGFVNGVKAIGSGISNFFSGSWLKGMP